MGLWQKNPFGIATPYFIPDQEETLNISYA